VYLALSRDDAERIITHDDVYPYVRDDGSVEPHEYKIPDGVICLVVYDPEPVACSIFYPRNSITYEIHTQTLPDGRSDSFRYGRLMLAWIWENIVVEKLVATIPADNRKALLYTLKIGFEIEGICPDSFIRDGKTINQTHIGISRPKDK